MSKDLSPDHIHSMVEQVHQAVENRKKIETQIQDEQHLGVDPQEQAFESQLAARQSQYDYQSNEEYTAYTNQRQQIIDQADAEYARVKEEFESFVEETNQKHQDEQDNAEQELADNEWILTSVLDDSAETSPKRKFENFKIHIKKNQDNFNNGFELIDSSLESAKQIMGKLNLPDDDEEMSISEKPTDELDALRIFTESLENATEYSKELASQKMVYFFSGFKTVITFLFVTGIFFLPLFFLLDPSMFGLTWKPMEIPWIGTTLGIAVFLAGSIVMIFSYLLKDTCSNLFSEIQQASLNAKESSLKWKVWAKKELTRQKQIYVKNQKIVEQKRNEASEQFHSNQSAEIQNASLWKQQELTRANEEYPNMLEKIVADRDKSVSDLDQAFQKSNDIKKTISEKEIDEIQQAKNNYLQQRDGHIYLLWDQLKSGWHDSLENLGHRVTALDEKKQNLLIDWNDVLKKDEDFQDDLENLPTGIPMGSLQLDLNHIEEAVTENAELIPNQIEHQVPVILPFPEKPSLLLKAYDEGRNKAVKALQTAMLRFATMIPAGKIRFTIIDPVGLGENFSAFMHLGDYDELLISSRIWTESSHIERQLTDLTEHMENIFQKYLRNEFPSIEEYNKSAGEVAEPYHILVVANFPANFSETAARRLVSIASSGPRCGVYTLLSVDEKSPLPSNFELSDLEANANSFEWKNGSFYPSLPKLNSFPVQFDQPPEPDLFTKIVKDIGHKAKDIRKVEVPFEKIAPKADEIWSYDSRSEIEVPLGRAGALKLQNMSLGRGTSQHVLIAGKTGSGKSTFLHALIVNMALHYSPEEIEFYMIDFKKGVEFKTYANFQLPHARVIGIESDREFGVSVLERLNEILKERGDLFRDSGVQDIAGFRNHNPGKVMPRIMLIVDEFQEFFIEDDALSQQANLSLDRLVRQGRAFGIHVLLGSQTLGGAYSLARSTLGQVAVRIALQCSESDAHLILSETNSAARLLTRPGEAIYNDANGMMEGNHPFQIAWLNEDKKESLLTQIREKAIAENLVKEPPIVFEGNIPSEPDRNHELVSLMNGTKEIHIQQDKNQDHFWLGEAVAIGDPTQVTLYRQAGNNLLMVGQSPGPALGILSTAVVGVAAKWKLPEFKNIGNARFYILIDPNKDQEFLEPWQRIQSYDPESIQIIDLDQAPTVIKEVSEQVQTRKDSGKKDFAPIYLIIYNIGRFRDLRKEEDDYGYGSMDADAEVSTGKMLSTIYSEGPESGVHSMVWCDSFSNVDRWFSRKALKDFELKIAFQMNSSDSSSFVESPIASRLGTNRALYYMEHEGTFEKFRPYGPPTSEWLQSFGTAKSPAAVNENKPKDSSEKQANNKIDELSQLTDMMLSGSNNAPVAEQAKPKDILPEKETITEEAPAREQAVTEKIEPEKKQGEPTNSDSTNIDDWDIS